MRTDAFNEAELSSFLPSRVGGACRTVLVFSFGPSTGSSSDVDHFTACATSPVYSAHPVKYNQSQNVVLTIKEFKSERRKKKSNKSS